MSATTGARKIRVVLCEDQPQILKNQLKILQESPEVEVRLTARGVDIFFRGERIAVHMRGSGNGKRRGPLPFYEGNRGKASRFRRRQVRNRF